MFQPETYGLVLMFMITSMLCWGSWANTRKLTQGYAFSLFYWDYVIGIVAGSLLWAFTLGSLHGGSDAFISNLRHTDLKHLAYAFAGGVVFNIANLILVAAIDIAGMAVAFPVGIGLALVIGAALNYLISPSGNPYFLFSGVALVVSAIVLDALAFKQRDGELKVTGRGIWLSLLSGLLMGTFFPLVAKSTIGSGSLGPYAVAFIFALGVAACSLPVNSALMKRSLTGEPPSYFSEYRSANRHWHFWGVLGGVIWCTGAVASFVASRAHAVGPAISYAIGQGATMVSALWGVFVWKEFAGVNSTAKTLLVLMFLCFFAGLAAIAVAPLVAH